MNRCKRTALKYRIGKAVEAQYLHKVSVSKFLSLVNSARTGLMTMTNSNIRRVAHSLGLTSRSKGYVNTHGPIRRLATGLRRRHAARV